MSTVIDKARAKVQELEEIANDPDTSGWNKKYVEDALSAAKKRLEILQKGDLGTTTNDIKAILSHIHAVNEKYNCRSVKFMLAVAAFLEKPRAIAPGLARRIKNYIASKINQPVCNIVSKKTAELPPMPSTPVAESDLDRQVKAQLEQMVKHKQAAERLLAE